MSEGTEGGKGDRRSFIRSAAWGGGIVGVGGLAGLAASRFLGGSPRSVPTRKLGPEFSYDVAQFQKTDPSLVIYEESLRFSTEMEAPRSLAIDARGMIHVAGAGGVKVFDVGGQMTREILLDEPVHAVVVQESGEVLAGQRGRILVIGAEGEIQDSWDDFPDGLLPCSIAIDSGVLFVADALNRVVHRLSADGERIGVIEGGPGFKVPSPYFCLRVGPDGLLRVANPGGHQIEAYTMRGDFELGWGKASFAIDGFCGCCNPVGFDVFADGSFVTSEKGIPRVKIYDPQGGFVGVVAGPEHFPEYLKVANAGAGKREGAGVYVALDPEERVVILDAVSGEVTVMVRKGEGDE